MKQKGRGLTLITAQYLSCPKLGIRHIVSACSVISYWEPERKRGYPYYRDGAKCSQKMGDFFNVM